MPNTAPYGWILDSSWLPNEKGGVGPSHIDPEIEQRLQDGQGRQFRMLDSDRNVLYSGRILTFAEDGNSNRYDEKPLDQFGSPNAGCTEIQYFDEPSGLWKTV